MVGRVMVAAGIGVQLLMVIVTVGLEGWTDAARLLAEHVAACAFVLAASELALRAELNLEKQRRG